MWEIKLSLIVLPLIIIFFSLKSIFNKNTSKKYKAIVLYLLGLILLCTMIFEYKLYIPYRPSYLVGEMEEAKKIPEGPPITAILILYFILSSIFINKFLVKRQRVTNKKTQILINIVTIIFLVFLLCFFYKLTTFYRGIG